MTDAVAAPTDIDESDGRLRHLQRSLPSAAYGRRGRLPLPSPARGRGARPKASAAWPASVISVVQAVRTRWNRWPSRLINSTPVHRRCRCRSPIPTLRRTTLGRCSLCSRVIRAISEAGRRSARPSSAARSTVPCCPTLTLTLGLVEHHPSLAEPHAGRHCGSGVRQSHDWRRTRGPALTLGAGLGEVPDGAGPCAGRRRSSRACGRRFPGRRCLRRRGALHRHQGCAGGNGGHRSPPLGRECADLLSDLESDPR
jgi:hypothetical protein